MSTNVSPESTAGQGGGPPPPPAARGPLDRLLNVFTDVRAGEAGTALLLMLNVFLLLAGYYLLKTVREPLILAVEESGAEYKAYSNAAIAALLMFLVPAYGAVASRVSRVKLINGVVLFFIACLVAFFAWAQALGVPGSAPEGGQTAAAAGQGRLLLGIVFFIWVGIFNVMVIAQAWAFANDVYTVERGKRLFPIIMLGASVGAIVGAYATKPLIASFGLYPLMLMAAGSLIVCMLLTNTVHLREKRGGAAPPVPAGPSGSVSVPAKGAEADSPIRGKGGFSLVLADRYLLLIAMLMMILNLVNTTGEYILGERVSEVAKNMVAQGSMAAEDEGKWIGTFYGGYFFWVNLVSAGLQAFLVSRIIRRIGVRGSLLVVPFISLLGYATLAFVPLLALIRVVKTTENSLDYSLQNTTRQALFLPTSREAKYKAKQATDTFFWRFGDLLSAGVVFAGVNWLGFATGQFALANAGLVLVWLGVAFLLGRRFQELARTK